MTNLIISVNPFTNNIKVQTVQDSTASYNINVDDSNIGTRWGSIDLDYP